MKLILAVIQPSKLEAVKEALNKVEVFRLTIVDVQGFGRQKGHSEAFRGHELTVKLLRKVQLQIAVNEDFVEPTVNAIMEAGRSGAEGAYGDGKILSCRWKSASASAPASAAPKRSDMVFDSPSISAPSTEGLIDVQRQRCWSAALFGRFFSEQRRDYLIFAFSEETHRIK